MSGDRRRHRLELVAVGARLAEAGLILPGEGNLSVRMDDGNILITPAGADKGRLRADQLVVLGADRSTAGRPVSMEAELHRALYRRQPPVQAVIHAHPAAVQALAGRDRAPDLGLLLEAVPVLGGVARVVPLAPGSAELAAAVATAMDGAGACVLERHGAVTVGATVAEALLRMLLLERLAHLALQDLR